jgi:transcriptional regulator with XRE-family HTH domain
MVVTASQLPLAAQLREAWLQKGWTLEELARRAGLKCSTDSLSRKLSGHQILTTHEAEDLANALGAELKWRPTPRPAQRRRSA